MTNGQMSIYVFLILFFEHMLQDIQNIYEVLILDAQF